MAKDFYVWATNRHPNQGACQWYRIKTPLRHLERLGYAKCYEDKGSNQEDDLAAMMTADIDLFYSVVGQHALHQMCVIKEMKAGKIQTGELHYPPTMIWDCDDNFDYIHPFNQSYAAGGVRHYPSGDLLEPGETLEWEDEKGNKQTLWEDGVTRQGHVTFNIAKNLNLMKVRHSIIKVAHGVTVPSPALASYIRDVVGQPNVYVFPNTIDPSDYEEFPLVPLPDGKIRILWQGGQSHLVDWYPLRDAIAQVAKKYPQTEWVIYGEEFDWVLNLIPKEQLIVHPWTPYDVFRLKRGLLQTSINLCPLADNLFNRCKSAIKWYEASIWKNPEITLAANVGPYKEEIQDGETGLLYNTPDEFVEKIELLINNIELRKRLAEGAKKWVLKNRTPEATIPGLFDFYAKCRTQTTGGKIIKPTKAQIAKVIR